MLCAWFIVTLFANVTPDQFKDQCTRVLKGALPQIEDEFKTSKSVEECKAVLLKHFKPLEKRDNAAVRDSDSKSLTNREKNIMSALKFQLDKLDNSDEPVVDDTAIPTKLQMPFDFTCLLPGNAYVSANSLVVHCYRMSYNLYLLANFALTLSILGSIAWHFTLRGRGDLSRRPMSLGIVSAILIVGTNVAFTYYINTELKKIEEARVKNREVEKATKSKNKDAEDAEDSEDDEEDKSGKNKRKSK